jgi:xanthine/CO dehydrogenase XdhC/CoxF family maturation factor
MSTASIEELSEDELDAHTAVVVATHNAAYDERALRRILPGAVRYVGVLGPRQRTGRMLEGLRSVGDVRIDGARVFAPTGLDIGAETPEQIALSVLAEIQAVMSGRPGTSLRNRPSSIHSDPLST